MKFTLSWLKEHLDTDATVAQISERLTSIGLEVESVTDPGAGLKDFIVGEVVTAEKHPNADKLRLCSVATGTDNLQIVCGAPNARAGIKVVLARPGTVIPATGEALKLGTIRGVESRGMMCSARELLLGEDHDGIIELKPGVKVGEPVVAALVEAGLLANDPLFDVSITPNRGDAASVWGIARDLAASGLGRLKTEKVQPVAGKFPSPVTVALDFAPHNKTACPIFAGRLIRGVRNGPAPKWVQDKLKSVGMKSISALVDATNLVSQDRGRPLHVFDADKLTGGIRARMAKDGEQVLALDDMTYTLDGNAIVIADDARALGIAGIMGGKESGSYDTTVNVFLESAFFDPGHVARTGRKQGIISDARYRFERGVDPQFVLPGLELATQLILDWCGGEASDVVIAGELPPSHKPILFDPAFVEKLGGIVVPRERIIEILENLGFVVEDHAPKEQSLHVVPPSWRHDVDGPADLVEEVVRIHGLADVPSVPLARPSAVAVPVLSKAQRRTRTARRALAVRGFNECVSFSFIARDQAALFGGGDDARQLSNPIASDLDALRPALLPSLLAAATRNAAPRAFISWTRVVRMRAPDAPMGWPMAMAPPLTFTFAGSRPNSFTTQSDWAAKASLDSIRSRSDTVQPAFSSAFFEAGMGPVPMISGSTPALAQETIRARGSIPRFLASSAVIRTMAAAPSLRPEALPAVTDPSLLKAGFSPAMAS